MKDERRRNAAEGTIPYGTIEQEGHEYKTMRIRNRTLRIRNGRGGKKVPRDRLQDQEGGDSQHKALGRTDGSNDSTIERMKETR